MAKWWDDLKEKAVEYLTDRYGGDKAESQETINAALALGLQPMTVSNQPTTKAAITDFTEVQDVAKGGLMSLPSKKRKKYSTGPSEFEVETMDDEVITPFDLQMEEGVQIGPMVEKLIDKLIKQGVIDENTSKEELKKILDQMQQAKNGPVRPIDIPWPTPENPVPAKKGGLMSLPNKKRKRYAGGPNPNEFNDDGVPMELEEIPITPYDLQMEEGVQLGPMVQEPELVKPPWMTQDEYLNPIIPPAAA